MFLSNMIQKLCHTLKQKTTIMLNIIKQDVIYIYYIIMLP